MGMAWWTMLAVEPLEIEDGVVQPEPVGEHVGVGVEACDTPVPTESVSWAVIVWSAYAADVKRADTISAANDLFVSPTSFKHGPPAIVVFLFSCRPKKPWLSRGSARGRGQALPRPPDAGGQDKA